MQKQSSYNSDKQKLKGHHAFCVLGHLRCYRHKLLRQILQAQHKLKGRPVKASHWNKSDYLESSFKVVVLAFLDAHTHCHRHTHLFFILPFTLWTHQH